jgi:hypothetical protein
MMIRFAKRQVPRRQENTMKSFHARITVLMLSIAYSSAAQARTVEYVSQHPVPHKFGGGFCYIDVPHVHNYPPDDPRMFRETNGQLYFVGDPAPFDYDGPRYTYYGAHPVAEAEVRLGHPVYCYLKGPHYHWYQPPPQAQFQLNGGAYWYVGPFPHAYYDERPRYGVINEAYAPMPYARPVVDVQVAPPMFRADIAIGGPGWGAHAVVGAPLAPAPVMVAPAPMPVQIGVGINIGGPVVGGPAVIERREIIEERYHHDHGRHEGWREREYYDRHPHHGPPARFIAAPAPVRQPVFGRARPAPAPRFAPGPPHGGGGPMHGPAPSAPGHNDHRHH